MNTGEEFVKKLKPLGCAAFLLLTALTVLICFTSKGVAVDGYVPPQDSEYYAEHLDELKQEIEENLLPLIGVNADLELTSNAVRITAGEDDLNTLRPRVIHYYDAELFEFVYGGTY